MSSVRQELSEEDVQWIRECVCVMYKTPNDNTEIGWLCRIPINVQCENDCMH